MPVFPVGQMALFVLVTVLFFLWGMSNNLTDILVQQFKKSFELSTVLGAAGVDGELYGLLLHGDSGGAGDAALGLQGGDGDRAVPVWGGDGDVLAGGGERAVLPFLVALFAVGCGASILETAANPFMAQFGPAPTSERRLNFAQSFNPPGTILGVWLGRTFIFSGVEMTPAQVAAHEGGGDVRGHICIRRSCGWCRLTLRWGRSVLLFAFVLSRMQFPTIASEHEGDSGGHGSFAALLHYPQLWFAVAANVLQCGRADLRVEQHDLLYEAVHDGERKDGGELHYLLAGGDAGWGGLLRLR